MPVKPGGAAGPVLPVPAVSFHDYPVAVGGGGWVYTHFSADRFYTQIYINKPLP